MVQERGSDPDRLLWLGQLKVALTAAVIVGHCLITYGADGSWYYHERSRIAAFRIVVDVPVALGALFAMGAFFFVAGCLVPGSLSRRGPAAYLKARFVRLGVPTLLFVVLVAPATEWLVARATGGAVTPSTVWRDQLARLDTGPLWFAAALLIFTAAATVLVLGGRKLGQHRLAPVDLVWCAAGVSVVSFLTRLRFAVNTDQVGSLHLWQWGQCLGLFVLGLAVGESGFAPLSLATVRTCRRMAWAGIAAVAAVLGVFHDDLDPFGGGLTWQSALVCVIEGVASVSATVILLDLFRDRLLARVDRRLPAAAFGAYVVQAPVVVALSLALRPLALDGSIKVLFVAPAAVVVSFVLGCVSARGRGARSATRRPAGRPRPPEPSEVPRRPPARRRADAPSPRQS